MPVNLQNVHARCCPCTHSTASTRARARLQAVGQRAAGQAARAQAGSQALLLLLLLLLEQAAAGGGGGVQRHGRVGARLLHLQRLADDLPSVVHLRRARSAAFEVKQGTAV